MRDKIYKVENVGLYLPLKKVIIVPKNSNMSDEIVIDKELLDKLPDYSGELKKIPNKKMDISSLYIKSIGLLLTNECPLHCIYCFSEAGDKKSMSLSYEQIDVIIKEIVKNAVIQRITLKKESIESKLTLSGGGEPTYCWEKFKYCVEKFKSTCNEKNITPRVMLVTNGCLSGKKSEYVIENIDEINISFDGIGDVQNTQRPLKNGKGSYEIVKRFIDKCGLYKKKILIRTTILPDNFKRIPEIVDNIFAVFPNVDCIHLEPMIYLGRAAKMEQKEVDSCFEFENAYIDAYQMVEKKYPEREIVNSLFSYGLNEYFCSSSLGTHPWVHMDGSIMACKDYLEEEHRVGLIYENKVAYNDNFSPMLSNNKNCEKCFAYYHCAGGCNRSMPKDENGICLEGNSRNMCRIIKDFWKKALTNLAQEVPFCGLYPKRIGEFSFYPNYKIVKIENNLEGSTRKNR